jgi:microcin C transport system substrate-binding protein
MVLLAEAAGIPVDFSSVTYRLREQAKWHDGTPVTPDDVIFSFEAVKKYSPQLSAYYRHVIPRVLNANCQTYGQTTSGQIQ